MSGRSRCERVGWTQIMQDLFRLNKTLDVILSVMRSRWRFFSRLWFTWKTHAGCEVEVGSNGIKKTSNEAIAENNVRSNKLWIRIMAWKIKFKISLSRINRIPWWTTFQSFIWTTRWFIASLSKMKGWENKQIWKGIKTALMWTCDFEMWILIKSVSLTKL